MSEFIRPALAVLTTAFLSCSTGGAETNMEDVHADAQSEATVMLQVFEEDVPPGWHGNETDEPQDMTFTCAATNIGEGWFATEQHCFSGLLSMADLWVDNPPFDLTTQRDPSVFTLWQASEDPATRQAIGPVDAVITANDRESTVALIHVSDAADVPAVDVSEDPPEVGERYLSVGYPERADGAQDRAVVEFIGTVSAGRMYEAYGYAYLESDIYVFGSEEPGTIAPGFSGGSLVSAEDGEVVATNLAIVQEEDEVVLPALEDAGQSPGEDYVELYLASPVDPALVESYQAAVGQPQPVG